MSTQEPSPLTVQQQAGHRPGARREAELVAKFSGVSALTGNAATKKAVMATLRATTQPDLIYFATHAIASETRSLDEGFLVLASEGSPEEARLTAREIQSLSLRADLAVLSACQTGLGGRHAAGVVGVGRAFHLAGVPHVLTSLWSIADESTASLMGEFTMQLRHGVVHRFFPSDALRHAMLEVRRRNPDPSHWASFVHFGVPNVFHRR